MATKNTITTQKPTPRTLEMYEALGDLDNCRAKLSELAALFASINDAGKDEFRIKALATLGRNVASDWAVTTESAVERIMGEIEALRAEESAAAAPTPAPLIDQPAPRQQSGARAPAGARWPSYACLEVLEPTEACSAIDLQDGIDNGFRLTQALFTAVGAMQRGGFEHQAETLMLAELGETIGQALKEKTAALAQAQHAPC